MLIVIALFLTSLSFLVITGQAEYSEFVGWPQGNYDPWKWQCNGPKKGSSKCYEGLGCVNLTDDFYDERYRPCNLLPVDRNVLGTRFFLYTVSEKKKFKELNVKEDENLTSSGIDSNHPTKIIIPDVGEDFYHNFWVKTMKDALLDNGDYNVIIVDWHKGSRPSYLQAVANARLVGAEVAELIGRLQAVNNINAGNLHIIGNGLGAHIAGYAGDEISGLSRITGLDPSDKYFGHMPESVRLDRSDAEFVDVIHTDIVAYGSGFGMPEPLGHVDFYPNGGRHQPGCSSSYFNSNSLANELYKGHNSYTLCSHHSGIYYFIDSLKNKDCTPVAHSCDSWQDFGSGKCPDCGSDGSKCAVIGIRAEEYRSHKAEDKSQKMYILTNQHQPFCVFQYQIQFEFNQTKDDHKGYIGDLNVILHSDKRSVYLQPSHGYYHQIKEEEKYSMLIASAEDLGIIQNVTVKSGHFGTFLDHYGWNSSPGWPASTVVVEKITIIPMNVITTSEEGRLSYVFEFCRVEQTEDEAKKRKGSYILDPCV